MRVVFTGCEFGSVRPATSGATRCDGMPFHRLALGAALSLADSVWNLALSGAVSRSTNLRASCIAVGKEKVSVFPFEGACMAYCFLSPSLFEGLRI